MRTDLPIYHQQTNKRYHRNNSKRQRRRRRNRIDSLDWTPDGCTPGVDTGWMYGWTRPGVHPSGVQSSESNLTAKHYSTYAFTVSTNQNWTCLLDWRCFIHHHYPSRSPKVVPPTHWLLSCPTGEPPSLHT